MNQFTQSSPVLLGSALAFSGGTFLCISCSDLLPELHFHVHDRFWLSVALLGGLAIAVAILFAEAEASGHGKHARTAPPRWGFCDSVNSQMNDNPLQYPM